MPTDGFEEAERDEGYWSSLGKGGDRALHDATSQGIYRNILNRPADQRELDEAWKQELSWVDFAKKQQGRASNIPGGPLPPVVDSPPVDDNGEDNGPDNNGSYPGYPTAERSTFTTPERPSPYSSTYQTQPYSSTYQPQYAEQFTGVGQDQRNRLMNAILANPETMGQVQQDQLFEQQKEMLNALRVQQGSALDQNLLRGGMSGIGGRALQGLQNTTRNFNSQLLAGRRDIAVQAAQQNRADTNAALQMQEAIAQGDSGRMMEIFNANNQARAQKEDFLRQAASLRQTDRAQKEDFLRSAASLNQSGTLGWNQLNLSTQQARHGSMMDYYNFLENQRQAENTLGLNYSRILGNAPQYR